LFRAALSAYIRKTGLSIIFEYRQGKINYFLLLDNFLYHFFRIYGYETNNFIKKPRHKVTGNFHAKSARKETRFDLIGRRINLVNFSFKKFACRSKVTAGNAHYLLLLRLYNTSSNVEFSAVLDITEHCSAQG
jgi:hypothetical protein